MDIRRRWTPLGLALALAAGLALPQLAEADTSIDLRLRIGDRPPPPAVVFEAEPDVILIPSSRVYFVPKLKFDLFRYGRYWYINNHGHWYRAKSYRGPFVYIAYEKIPRSIVRVPAKYHRHPLGGPPGKTGVHPTKARAVKKAKVRHEVKEKVKKRKNR